MMTPALPSRPLRGVSPWPRNHNDIIVPAGLTYWDTRSTEKETPNVALKMLHCHECERTQQCKSRGASEGGATNSI